MIPEGSHAPARAFLGHRDVSRIFAARSIRKNVCDELMDPKPSKVEV